MCQILEDDEIRLRAVEPTDADLLYLWENDTTLWQYGSTIVPFSRYVLQEYVNNAQADIYEAKQLRLMIVQKQTGKTVGSVDLYDFDPRNRRAGVGILVVEESRNQHIATRALQLLAKYCKETLLLHQLYADVQTSNVVSLQLFENVEFMQIGVKKDWLQTATGYEDVAILQKIL